MIRPDWSKKAQVKTSCRACMFSLLRFPPATTAHAVRTPQAAHAYNPLTSAKFGTSWNSTYQNRTDNDNLAPRKLTIMLHGCVMIVVVCTNCSSPMHARDSKSKDTAANTTSPPTICPSGPPPKEDRQRNSTSKHRNDGGTDDVCNPVATAVVADTELADIMHTTYCTTREYTTRQDSEITGFLASSYAVEGNEQDDNRKHERYARKRHAINDLELRIPISQDNGTVSNVMHTPDTDTTHCYGGGEQ